MIIRFLVSLLLIGVLANNFSNAQNVNLYLEDFESDGNNSRYFLSHQFYDFPLGSYFGRGTLAQLNQLPGGITGLGGSHLVGAEDLDRSASGPSNGIVSFTTRPIRVDSFAQIIFGFKLGARSANNYDFYTGSNNDWVDVDFRYDGGAWTRLMQFRNGPIPTTNSQRIFRDNDLDNLGGDQAQDSVLSESMIFFSDTTLVTGDSVEFRIRLRCNSSSEELFFDQVTLIGVPSVVLPPTLNRMLYQYMGYTTDNLQDNLWCTVNGLATAYEFEVSGSGFTTQNIVNPTNKLNLTQVPGMTYNRTYNLRHRIITSGGPGVWSDAYYGFWTINVSPAAVPVVMSPLCGGTINLLSDEINFTRIGNATNYRLNVSGPNSFTGTDTLNSTNNEFTLASLGATEAGTYQVQVSAEIGGVFQAFSSTCNVTLASLTPQISILSNNCGGIVTNLNKGFYTEDVPSVEYYEWRLRGDGDPITQLIIQNNGRLVRISDFPSIEYNETYTLDVRYRVNGLNAPFGPDCIFTLAAPTLNVRKPSCGSTITDSLDVIWTTPIGGATYEYSVFNGFFDTLIQSSAPYLVFNQLNNAFDLSTINVSIRPIISGLTTTFGDTCTFTYTQARMSGGKRASQIFANDNANEIGIYPNPNSGYFALSGNTKNITEVKLYNLQGKNLKSWTKIDLESGNLYMDELPDGQYLLKVLQSDQSTDIHRLIKF